MPKKETNSQSSNQKEINKKETEEEHKQQIEKRPLSDTNKIKEIIRLIADSSYEGRYTLERYTKSLYRFGFGISEPGNIPSMFVGKTANEAMYRAIDFELTAAIKLMSRERLTKLAEDRLATIMDEQQKRKGMEEKIAAKNIEYKESMKERDELKQEGKSISNIIDRVVDSWKDDVVMQPFKKDLASWRKKPSILIAFLLENIEKLTHDAASYVAPSIEAPEKRDKERPLREGLATVNNIRILKPIWNDLQNKLLDGEWHAFSEVDEIIRTHGNRELTVESIRMKRGAYIRFAKDEKYHIARGGKDYLYERKTFRDGNKFRFTPVGEELKPEKMVEKREEALLELEERSLRKERILARVGKDVNILEPLWNDLQDSVMDGKWHAFSEANEIIKRHGYSQITMGRISQIRKGYFKFAKDTEYHIARGGKDYLFERKRTGDVYKFRFTPSGEEPKPEKLVGIELEMGRIVDYVSEHPIHENPRDEFIRLFCDGKWHSASEPVELLKRYDNYSRCKESSLPPLRSAYMGHVQKSYPKFRKRKGTTYKFKFGKKFDKTELAKIQERKPKKSPNNVKCARCGHAIQYDEECHQVDNLFYCPDCYKVIEA